MAYESIKIREVVDRAVNHTWSIPEFQRGFVWKSTQVRDLAESLWLDYPIGSLLVWNSQQEVEARAGQDAQSPALWVVDGQQRATALSILFGRKPYWWDSASEWEKTLTKYDLRFDIDAKEPPYFRVANAAIRRAKGDRYIPLRNLLVLDTQKEKDQQKLQALAKEIKHQGLCDGMDAMEVFTRIDRIRKIRDKEVVTISVDHELEDVVEIFSRLNSRGTRVTEADIYLGVVAARTPGWVRGTFLPYRDSLADAGFDLSPNLLFRSLTGVGAKKVKFKEIPNAFWDQSNIHPYWGRTKQAWNELILQFRKFGVLSNTPMPTQAALVTMIALLDKFPGKSFEPALYWFLQASRWGRYSGSGATALEEDLRDVQEADSLHAAAQRLLNRLPHERPLEAEDFLRDYGDWRFGRFLLYLLVYRNEAQDWDQAGHRIGFEGLEVLADFRPQWHHVFPRKFLEGKAAGEKIDALANIAVIGPSINIRISAKDPMDYIERYGIAKEKLVQQFIDPSISGTHAAAYEAWLKERADKLAQAGNAFLSELKES
ncbi:DUF262 domain-containing protein [Rubrobacter tropicus]|uniref:DUF262 domain-containing protein n=1 Tax=Rubrobacter tropicus TaxID=2653851 RepID=A0A6G8Q550_9ACTN|nr:DUF262 domain-containing protein [Rubrobacter tropicus]QIN81580.1 DUF262 domain-containing protein [Rubrobacter tropicus]